MAPRVSVLCTQALKDDGVYGAIDLQPFPLELVPLEKDVLSLEYPNSYAAIFQVSCVASVWWIPYLVTVAARRP